jgi:hypothetical protein
VGGQTDDGVGTEDAPGQRDRGVVLPDVHPVGPDGQGQVRTVVQDEGDTSGAAGLAHHGRALEQGAGVQLLVPQLHHVDPALDAGGDEVSQVGPVRGAEVEVAGREVEAGAHADARALAFSAFFLARTLAMLSASVMSATER